MSSHQWLLTKATVVDISAIMVDSIDPHSALAQAVNVLGSQASMASLCGLSATAVWKWVNGRKHLPAEHVLKVEAATGVSRHDLRPDLYPHESSPLAGSAPSAPIIDVENPADQRTCDRSDLLQTQEPAA